MREYKCELKPTFQVSNKSIDVTRVISRDQYYSHEIT